MKKQYITPQLDVYEVETQTFCGSPEGDYGNIQTNKSSGTSSSSIWGWMEDDNSRR